MLLWIVIYSFFQSNDFNDEVVILFGNVPFWASVVISIIIALAPRFLIKFISTSYLPLDRDIVREMWVYGDLKDRLGIKHRKVRKRGDIEGTPMFHQPHARSQSEVSVLYESGRASTSQFYSDSPSETGQRTRSPPPQPDYVDSAQDPTPMQPVHSRVTYQHVDSSVLRQRYPSDATSPTSTVGLNTIAGYAQTHNTPPRQTAQNVPAPSYEMQVRHQQELTNTSYRTADEDWDDEPRSAPRTPDNRYTPGQAL